MVRFRHVGRTAPQVAEWGGASASTFSRSAAPPSSVRELVESEATRDALFWFIRWLLRRRDPDRGRRWIEEEAMDVLQDALLRALERESTYRPEKGGLAWLKTVARHVVWDRRARSRRRGEVADRPVEEIAATVPAVTVEDGRWLWELVERLPPNQRDVLRLRFGAGMDPPSIAVKLGHADVQTVYRLRNRAVNNLRGPVAASLA